VLKVDDAANIWFYMSRPEQNLLAFDKEFPARMQFYRKGKGYHLQITGRAYIVDDPEEVYGAVSLPEHIKEQAFRELLLVKVSVSNVAYYEYDRKFARRRTLKAWFRDLYGRLFKDDTRPAPTIFQLTPTANLGF
jgi:hypothetical protein